MPLTWIILTGAAIIGMVAYDVAVKLATYKINAFVFTVVLTLFALIFHVVALLGYRFYKDDFTLDLSPTVLGLAALGGLGYTIMNLGFFMAVKSGGLSITNAVFLIGAVVITVILGYFAFQEYLDYKKVLGILFGVLSIYLMVI